MPELRSPQRKLVVRRFPQAQSHELLIHTIINFWPKRAHDVLACRRRAAKILRFQIQMPILPGFQRFMNRIVQRYEIVKRSAALIVISSDRSLCQVAMAVASRIIALTIKPLSLGARPCIV